MKTSRALWKLTAFLLAVLTIAIALPAQADDDFPAVPGPFPPQAPTRPVPFFVGHAAAPKPVDAPVIPQNPYMALGSWSSFHSDTFNSDTVDGMGPLGNSPIVTTYFVPGLPVKEGDLPWSVGIADLMAWGTDGRMVAGITQFAPGTGELYWRLMLIDPGTMQVLDYLNLPKGVSRGSNVVPSGSYGYLDAEDRNVTVNPDGSVWRIEHTANAFEPEDQVEKYGLKDYLRSGEDNIETIQPDFSGRLWFATELGVIGILDMEEEHPAAQVLATLMLPEGELVENGVAADKDGGMYLVSSKAMYRLDYRVEADGKGVIDETWREPYDSGPPVKVLSLGSGTSPTLMGENYVTIADNAEPQIHVLVYRRAKDVQGSRLVCSVPVFKPGNSNTENSLIATDKSIVVGNNFGYRDIWSVVNGKTTKPGFARIDVDQDGNGCPTVWTNDEIGPIIVPKLALHSGLVYSYTKVRGPANTDAWYFTAFDFDSGETIYKVLAGTATGVRTDNSPFPLYSSHMGIVIIGPDGVAYIPVFGGFVTIRDLPG
jgi:hypothetical protein